MADNRVYSITLTFAKTDGTTQKIVGSPSIIVSHSTSASVYTQDMSNANRTGWNIALDALTFKKRMYYPCRIDATLSISRTAGTLTLPKVADLKAWFVGAVIGMKADCVDGTVADVAEKYKVFDCTPVYRSNGSSASSLSLGLAIFSPDYVMATSKFSEVHVSQKLSDIVLKQMARFNMESDESRTSAKTYFNPHLRLLAYTRKTKKNNKDGTVDDELIQPYLVQYNETFHDFLRRTANRCGEFVYYEKGKFNLGYCDAYSTDDTKKKEEQSVYELKKYSSVVFHNANVADTGLKVSTFHRDPVAEASTSYACSVVSGEVKETASSGTVDRPFKLQGVSDEFLQQFSKDKFDSTVDQWLTYNHSYVSVPLMQLLGAPSLIEGITKLGFSFAYEHSMASQRSTSANDKYVGEFFPGSYSVDHFEVAEGTELKDAKTISQIATHQTQIGSGLNIGSKLISTVHDCQARIWDEALEIDLGSSLQDIYLGKKIKVEGGTADTYIVVEVSGKGVSKSAGEWTDVMNVIAVPFYWFVKSDNPFPPSIEDSPIRFCGPQPALVTTSFDNDGKRLGRVMVRYPWQGSETPSSPWIRVSTQHADHGGGNFTKPKAGNEVLIDYEDGNIEQPYVAGYLYHAGSKDDPETTPDGTRMFSNVMSTDACTSIRMKESKDALKFWKSIVPAIGFIKSCQFAGSNSALSVEKESYSSILGVTEFTDSYGLYTVTLSSPDRKISIESPFGNVTFNGLTGIEINAPQGDVTIRGKNVNISAGNNIEIESGCNIVDKRMLHKSSFKDPIKAAAKDLLIEKVLKNVLDLSLVRTVLEIFLKPVEGTFRIHSNRFLVVEAGKGNVSFPNSAFRDEHRKYMTDKYSDIPAINYQECISVLRTNWELICNTTIIAIQTYCGSLTRCIEMSVNVKEESSSYFSDNHGDPKAANHAIAQQEYDAWKGTNSKKNPNQECLCTEADFNSLKDAINICDENQKFWSGEKLVNDKASFNAEYHAMLDDVVAHHHDKILKALFDAKSALFSGLGYDAHKNDVNMGLVTREMKLRFLRKAAWLFVKSVAGDVEISLPSDPSDDDYVDNAKWVAKVNGIKRKEDTLKSSFVDGLLDPLKENFVDNTYGVYKDHFGWANNSTGEILISQQDGKTISFTAEGGIQEKVHGFIPLLLELTVQ